MYIHTFNHLRNDTHELVTNNLIRQFGNRQNGDGIGREVRSLPIVPEQLPKKK